VWAVRIGSRTIRTVSSPALPSGDRAAVFLVPAKGPFPIPPGMPAGPPQGNHPPEMRNIHTIPIVPLDHSGEGDRHPAHGASGRRAAVDLDGT
jgi:hypothetical protein